ARRLTLKGVVERVRAAETDVAGDCQAQHLADRVTHLLAGLLASLSGPSAASALPNPSFDERFDVLWQVPQLGCAASLRELAESHKDGNTMQHAARLVALLRQPGDVLFDRWCNPGVANTIGGGRTDIVVLEHDNLPN